MESKNFHKNMEHTLVAHDGNHADSSSDSNESPNKVYIGSDIPPVRIGKKEEGDFENGVGFLREWWIIVQDGIPMLVDMCFESYNYGCQYMKNGGREYYKVYELAKVKNLVIDEDAE